jgi:hypothetical protein
MEEIIKPSAAGRGGKKKKKMINHITPKVCSECLCMSLAIQR